MILRQALRALASLVACYALATALYGQFADTVPDRPWLLGAAVLGWWFTGDPWSGRTPPPRGAGQAGRARTLVAWAARGLALSGAAGYYVMAGLDRERIDPVLAGCAVVLIAAGLLRTAGRRGLLATAARVTAGVVLALFGRFVGLGLAELAFWVPTHARTFLDERAGWAATPGTWLVWLLWAVVVGVLTGVIQSYEIRLQRTIRTTTERVVRSRTRRELPYGGGHETIEEFDQRSDEDVREVLLSGPPPRTGLRPVLQWQTQDGGWSSTSSSHGTRYSQTEVTQEYGTWRIRSVQLPPAYLPGWLTRLLRALRTSRAARSRARARD